MGIRPTDQAGFSVGMITQGRAPGCVNLEFQSGCVAFRSAAMKGNSPLRQSFRSDLFKDRAGEEKTATTFIGMFAITGCMVEASSCCRAEIGTEDSQRSLPCLEGGGR